MSPREPAVIPILTKNPNSSKSLAPGGVEINRAAQISTKETYPWWWNKYGCEGTQWYGPEPCRDLTND